MSTWWNFSQRTANSWTDDCIIRTRRSSEFTLVGRTPASNATGEELLVVVKLHKAFANTNKYFVYQPNPTVIGIFPVSHLLTYVHTYLNYTTAHCESVKLEWWHFFMKLFKANTIDVGLVKTCQQYFNFVMPSTLWTKRSESIESKFSSSENVFCKITRYTI